MKLSIVIPVFNVENYVKQTMDNKVKLVVLHNYVDNEAPFV